MSREITFGDRVKERRLELGMSLQSLADVAGCSKTYLWQLENQDHNVSLHLGLSIAAELVTDVYDLSGVDTSNNSFDKSRTRSRVK